METWRAFYLLSAHYSQNSNIVLDNNSSTKHTKELLMSNKTAAQSVATQVLQDKKLAKWLKRVVRARSPQKANAAK
jgi:hypothetical protein